MTTTITYRCICGEEEVVDVPAAKGDGFTKALNATMPPGPRDLRIMFFTSLDRNTGIGRVVSVPYCSSKCLQSWLREHPEPVKTIGREIDR